MNNKVFSSLLLLFLATTLIYAQVPIDQGKRNARYMAPGDPNLNPNWDWTAAGPGHTMYYSENGATPIQLNNVQVPFYTSGHPLADAANNDQKDMWPQDGWMLVYRDFGTPTIAPALPFFALYNKYRGILRFMFYNAPRKEYSAYQVTLKFRDSSPKAALFTFTDKNKSFLNDYDGNKTESFLGKVTPFQDWAHADFIVAGYDPNLSSDAVFHLELDGIDESAIQLNSTQFTLNELLTQANPGGSKSSFESVKDAVNQGQKFYKSVNTTKKALKEAAEKATGNPWWKSRALNLSTSTVVSVAPFIGSLLGFVTSFIGGKEKASPSEPMSFEGSLKLEGNIITNRQLIRLDFALTPGNPVPDLYKPVQPIPWGIFNLTSKAVINITYQRNCYYDGWFNQTICEDNNELRVVSNIGYVLNPSLNMHLVSVREVLMGFYGPEPYYYTESDFANLVFRGYRDGFGGGTDYDFSMISDVGVELTFKITGPVKNSDDEIVIYKTYPMIVNRTYSGNGYRTAFEKGNEENSSLLTYPNPFNTTTEISYNLEKTGKASLKLYTLTGQEVKTFEDQNEEKGIHSVTWDGTDNTGRILPNGVYFCRVIAGGQIRTTKVVINR